MYSLVLLVKYYDYPLIHCSLLLLFTRILWSLPFHMRQKIGALKHNIIYLERSNKLKRFRIITCSLPIQCNSLVLM